MSAKDYDLVVEYSGKIADANTGVFFTRDLDYDEGLSQHEVFNTNLEPANCR